MTFLNDNKYTIPNANYLVSDFLEFESSRIFKDWEDFSTEKLPEYFEKGYSLFLSKLQNFKTLNRALTKEEEQELSFMLEALVHAKNARYES